MTSISQVLSQQITVCNHCFEMLQDALVEHDWGTAVSQAKQGVGQIQRHMQTEEDVLFQCLEQMLESDATTGPLRRDHDRIRELLTELDQAVRNQNRRRGLALCAVLNELQRRHNGRKKDHVYPLADRVLGRLAPALAQEMAWE